MSKGTVNKVILIGRLGRDPEMRYTSNGTAVVNFSLATNHVVKDASGNNNDQTEWHQVVAFGRTAEVAGEYLSKGRLVYIEGRLQTRSWDDPNGQKKYRTEVICSTMQLLGGREDSISASGGETEPEMQDEESENKSVKGNSKQTSPPEEEDDLPF